MPCDCIVDFFDLTSPMICFYNVYIKFMYNYSLISVLVFYEAARTGSFSRAAEKLAMTQPGVSHHIGQLEVQAGKPLIIRNKRGLTLTRDGKALFRQAERLCQAADRIDDLIKTIRQDLVQDLRIGTTSTYSRLLMPMLLSDFQKSNPAVRIHLDTGSSEEMVETVLNKRNDICIVANPKISRRLHAVPFMREELVLITARNHPLANRGVVDAKEISEYPLILRETGSAARGVVLDALADAGVVPSMMMEAKSTGFIKEWVSQGKGISILIKRAIRDDENEYLSVVPLKCSLALETSAVLLKSRKSDPLLQGFVRRLFERLERRG
jgi:DNA-binding transcriptional LysR family regulator